jgi:hypothetical protein
MILPTLPEACEQKTVFDELSSCQNTIHKVMESKESPYKIDENIMKVALKVSEQNPTKIDFKNLPHVASN